MRFYLPALGLIALLGAWLLVQLPRWAPPLVLAIIIGLGALSYPQLVASGVGAPGGTFGGGGGGIGGQPGGGSGPPPDGAPQGPPPGGAQPGQQGA